MAQDGSDNRLKAIFDNKEHPDYIPEAQQSVAAQFILKNIKNRNIDKNATIYLKDIAQERLVGDGDEKFVFIE